MKVFIAILMLDILFLFMPIQSNAMSIVSQRSDTLGQKMQPKTSRHPHFKISRSDKKLLKNGLLYFALGIGLASLGIYGNLVSFLGLLFIVAGQIMLVTGFVCMLIGAAGLRWYDS
jgi:hypothetical protein